MPLYPPQSGGVVMSVRIVRNPHVCFRKICWIGASAISMKTINVSSGKICWIGAFASLQWEVFRSHSSLGQRLGWPNTWKFEQMESSGSNAVRWLFEEAVMLYFLSPWFTARSVWKVQLRSGRYSLYWRCDNDDCKAWRSLLGFMQTSTQLFLVSRVPFTENLSGTILS